MNTVFVWGSWHGELSLIDLQIIISDYEVENHTFKIGKLLVEPQLTDG
jgi:hypothetical protein